VGGVMVVGDGVAFLKRLGKAVQDSDDAGLAAEMAYHLMLSLMPALVLLVSAFDLVGSRYNLFDESLTMLSRVAPREVMPLIRDTLGQIMAANSGRVALFGAVGLLWTASNGAAVVLKGVNRAYGVTLKTGMVRERLFAVAMILMLGLGMLVGLNLFFFGDDLIAFAGRVLTLSGGVMSLLHLARWLLVLGALVVVSALVYFLSLYQLTPRVKLRAVMPGALTFVGLWLLASWGFRLYIEHFAKFNQVYGALGVVIILLTWLFLTSFALLVGGEVNALVHQRAASRAMAGAPQRVRAVSPQPAAAVTR
jgi:membrane protein